ncbi:MAG: hypothetical protein A3E83_00545 [Gammaproteobacteria bacterium RIFCSPHIGHO2_12_FULL_41_20]|nr:MAG: hypothetical protein A3E83_00545 [Gammaproteobacteria bacterium RIFCSPHIGHO2_12_FULL_41_20]
MEQTGDGIMTGKKERAIVLLSFSLLLLMGFTEVADPTRPPYVDAKDSKFSSQSYILTAVFIQNGRRIAIVGGQPVREGDRLGQFIVTAITPYTVELVGSENERQILQLVPAIKKKRY